jgi:hypothetical protein
MTVVFLNRLKERTGVRLRVRDVVFEDLRGSLRGWNAALWRRRNVVSWRASSGDLRNTRVVATNPG